jgi:hypothetical protein
MIDACRWDSPNGTALPEYETDDLALIDPDPATAPAPLPWPLPGPVPELCEPQLRARSSEGEGYSNCPSSVVGVAESGAEGQVPKTKASPPDVGDGKSLARSLLGEPDGEETPPADAGAE